MRYKKVLRQGVIEGEIYPILCGSGVTNKGISLLLDNINTYMPSPADKEPEKGINPNTKKRRGKRMQNRCSFFSFGV